MRVMLIVVLAGCGGAPPQPAPASEPSPTVKRELAVAEPAPKQPAAPPQPPSREELILRSRRGPASLAQEHDVAEHDLWSPCVRDFAQAQPAHARRALRSVFARYVVTCDANKHLVLEPPPDYHGKSYVAFRGTLAANRRDFVVDFAVCGTTPSSDDVTINYDGKRWAAPTTASQQIGNCTIVSAPELPSLRRVLRDAIDARHAVAHLDVEHEIPLTDEIKRDLRLMLDALDALSAR